jgi:phosphoribosylaminoimidazolecarboxamide formyltransferase/IMP cyclohydrolase
MKTALISVYDKNGIVEFAQFLISKEIEIVSTGGTARYLKEEGIPLKDIAELTQAPEMLDGRVKTLHPKVHGGILAIRDNEEHQKTIKERDIQLIDMVVVNLYPFFDAVQKNISEEEKVEFIDIGGPTMLRSAAKNFQDVIVISDVADYPLIMKEWEEKGVISLETKKYLASKVFNLTSAYDAAIAGFLSDTPYQEYLSLSYRKMMDLRYGENPHQKAAYYVSTTEQGAMRDIEILNGKTLSFNNIRDMDVAWKVVNEFEEVACCGLKHSTPCGVALGNSVQEAYTKAYECDPISIFGGIVALNREVDEVSALEMKKIFLEIIIAPSFTEKALAILKQKKNLRLIKANVAPRDPLNIVQVDGGILLQDEDRQMFGEDMKTVTQTQATESQMADMYFGMKVVKHVKSNAIVVVKNRMALGIGTGETNRIWAARQAIERAGEGSVMASDAFFPFRDVVDAAAQAGIKAIIQPGGSMRDQESIDACDEHGIAMIFSGMRHFKH